MDNEIEKLNYVLTELKLSPIPPLSVFQILKNKYTEITEDNAFIIEQKLKRENYIDLGNISRNRKIAYINDSGKVFILKGGYVTEKQTIQKREQAIDSIIYKSENKITNQKNSKETKSTYIRIREIYNSLINRIEVMGDNEFAPVLPQIKVLLLHYYSDSHEYYRRYLGIINEKSYRSDLIGLLSEIITELELKIGDSDLSHLHPKVIVASEKLFQDEHYSEAVFGALKALIEIIKNDYPILDNKTGKLKDGRDLMQDVFSPDNPKIKLSDDQNERQGMMFLYSGAVAGLRNRYGHKSKQIKSEEAFEILHFISFLYRLYYDNSVG